MSLIYIYTYIFLYDKLSKPFWGCCKGWFFVLGGTLSARIRIKLYQTDASVFQGFPGSKCLRIGSIRVGDGRGGCSSMMFLRWFTPPKTNMVHLKIKPWKRRFPIKNPSFSGSILVFRGGICRLIIATHQINPTFLKKDIDDPSNSQKCQNASGLVTTIQTWWFSHSYTSLIPRCSIYGICFYIWRFLWKM